MSLCLSESQDYIQLRCSNHEARKMTEVSSVVTTFESGEAIPRDAVLRWLDSDDLSARGATFAYLERTDCVSRMTPSLTQDQFDDRYFDYLKRCLIEDARNEWVHSRYEAAWALSSWFKRAVARDASQQRLIKLRKWLATTYKTEPALRDTLLNGFLEHVLAYPGVSGFFKPWKPDPELRAALQSAQEWVDRGGT
jgi:hypothetical protein